VNDGAGQLEVIATLNSSGTTTQAVSLPSGTYQFIGSVSGYTTGPVTVDSNTSIIRLRPANIIYWYGVLGDTLMATQSGTITYNTTYMTWNLPGSPYRTWGTVHPSVDGTGVTSCTLRYDCVLASNSSYVRLGYGSQDNPNNENPRGNEYIRVLPRGTTDKYSAIRFTPEAGKTPRIYGYKYTNNAEYVNVYEWYLGNR